MPIFDVQFQIVVAGLGTRTVTVNNVTAGDAAAAITVAQGTLVQIAPIGVVRTAL